jgi:hypothetical protein
MVAHGAVRGGNLKVMVTLHDQRLLWNLWYAERITEASSLEPWERELAVWNQKHALEGGLWSHLYKWAKRKGHST